MKLTKIIANLYLTVSLKMPRRFRVKDTVWMELDDVHEDLLREMTLVDESDNILQGVRMHGIIRRKLKNHALVYFPAAEEELNVTWDKVNKVTGEAPVIRFVVVPDRERFDSHAFSQAAHRGCISQAGLRPRACSSALYCV